MKLVRRSQRRRARPIFTIAAPLLLVPLLLGFASQTATRPAQMRAIPGVSDRVSLVYADAAAAVRSKDCAGAFKALAPLTSDRGAEGAFARLLSGFYAHSCEQVGLAEDRLFAAGDPDGVLEDWRLYILSDAAAARGHVLVAQNALAKLLGDYPGSILRPRALVKAASLAWQRGDARRALELVNQGRREKLQGDEGTQLERLAWEIGTKLPDDAIRREAARRLLTDWPAAAAEMQVVEIFRPGAPANTTLDWSAVLTPEQLARRARALLALKLEPNAAAALDAVPAASRNLDWVLLRADVLTRLHQGADALTLLAPRSGEGRQAAALDWARAQAAADAATAYRGRSNRPSPERQRLRLLSRQSLAKVAQSGADPELAVKALRSLYADQVEESLFEASIDSLRSLRRLDPADTTGAANLWNQGWREYGKKNYSGAVGYWTELYSLYPEDSTARRGRYWTARAFQALGESERSQQIFREVAAADTTDFYRKNALAHLQKKPVDGKAKEEAPVEAWPNDPALTRARLLTDLGLDDLAGSELDLARAKAQPRSARALESLILARRGDRRKSVVAIRDAFPALGGAWQARLPEEARHLYYPLDYQEPIRNWAIQNHLPPYLVFGIIRQESAFDTNAQSWAGARGLMQLMPSTAKELAGNLGLSYSHDKLSDPDFNVRLGTHYFSHVLGLFDGNVDLALAGYNGGPYRIKRLWHEWKGGSGDIDRFLEGLNLEESKTYVKRILVLSDSYRQLYPLPG